VMPMTLAWLGAATEKFTSPEYSSCTFQIISVVCGFSQNTWHSCSRAKCNTDQLSGGIIGLDD
jgi:hypothetical protein